MQMSGITASTPKSLDSLPFTDVASMEGEPQEDRAVNSEVSRPSPTTWHSLSPSNAQCPSL